jgi:hypothetical protein
MVGAEAGTVQYSLRRGVPLYRSHLSTDEKDNLLAPIRPRYVPSTRCPSTVQPN